MSAALGIVLTGIWILLALVGLAAQTYLLSEFSSDLAAADGIEPTWGLMHQLVRMHIERTWTHLAIKVLALGLGLMAFLPIPRPLFGIAVSVVLIAILLLLTVSAVNDVRHKRRLLAGNGRH